MPTIDLDSPAPPQRPGVRVRPSRPLIAVLAGVVLFGLVGEPVTPASPLNPSAVCAQLPPIPGRDAGPMQLTIIDERDGQVMYVVTCEMPFNQLGQ
ncbi:hypothetical protein Ait01nite_077020 [Actinoplanes italicus]|uniref:Uncharacterized protein n=1 Tax=Actinoplanes italicus TaxID=113567 RepID=A0A2T0JZ33_9ACTN|nr:hypothetical protein [Actinoplanes italicus]PRX14792.1 hypothetical protein CLV67_123178 [Actinoplanes italicus]GIE34657.1 hypothetical protein Ait01nite_077020 [Actinoplanes italicus]